METDSTRGTSELIADGRALVRSLALQVYRNVPVKVDLEDLIAYGELGLAEAARDFDPELGNQFSTFAYYRIRGSIYDGLSKMTWTSRARYRRLRYLSITDDVLQSEHEWDDRVSDNIEGNGKWFSRVTERLAMVYLACDGDDDMNPLDSAIDPNPSPQNFFMHMEANSKLRTMVDRLPLQERRLIQLVYFEGFTLQEAGLQIGVSKSWASRLHAKILEQLANDMRRLDLHD